MFGGEGGCNLLSPSLLSSPAKPAAKNSPLFLKNDDDMLEQWEAEKEGEGFCRHAIKRRRRKGIVCSLSQARQEGEEALLLCER